MRSSSALVATDPQGRLLLQHRTDDAPTWPGYWGLFGGGREPGETAKECLVRELREELGLDASGASHVGTIVADFPCGAVDLSVFHLSLDRRSSDASRLVEGLREGQDLGLFRMEDLRRAVVVPCDLWAMELVLRSLAPSSPGPARG